MRKLSFLLALMMASAAGCALHISGLQDERGSQTLYAFDQEHDAFASAYEAVVSIIPDAPVKAAGGPMRGYSVTEAGLIGGGGEIAYTISILPGTGKGGGGEVFGYYVEVSVNDESISGRLTAKKIYRAIVENFRRDGRPVQVERIRLGKYIDGGFMRSGREAVDRNGDVIAADSLSEELLRLNQLRLSGGLTQKEYDDLKERLLKTYHN